MLHNGHRSGEGVTFLRQNLREGVTFLSQNLRPIGEGVTFLSNRHVSSPKPSAEHILGVGWATLRWCVRATQRRPPIARTAHVVHCACATCARVTRVGWSAVSQSRAVVESATGSGNHQHTGPSSTRAWLGCRTSVVQHKQHNVWAWWGSGAPRAPQDGGWGGVGAGLLRTLQRHRNEGKNLRFRVSFGGARPARAPTSHNGAWLPRVPAPACPY